MSSLARDLQHYSAKTDGFEGGLNMRDSANLLQQNEFVTAQNVVLEGRGSVAKRPGTYFMSTFGASGCRALSVYTYYLDPPDVPQLIVHTDEGRLYFSYDGVTWSPITYFGGAPVVVSQSVACSFETVNSQLFFCEGTGMWMWDGGQADAVTDAPAGVTYLRLWQDILWASGNIDLADRVYASATGDPFTWPVANLVDIHHGDNDKVMALFCDGQFLVVGKLRTMHVIYDSVKFFNRAADFEKGIESHFSVIHFDDGLYYLSRLGICLWQGDAPSIIISYKIDRLFRPDLLDYTIMEGAWGYFVSDRIGWLLPEIGADENTLTIEYYPRYGPRDQPAGRYGIGPWTMHRMPVGKLTTMRGAITSQFPNNTESLFGPHPHLNRWYEAFAPNIGLDDGQPFTSRVELAPFDLGESLYTKSLRRMRVLGRGKFVLELRRNYTRDTYRSVILDLETELSDSNVWDSGLYGQIDPEQAHVLSSTVVNWDAIGRAFQVVIHDDYPEANAQYLNIAGDPTLVPVGRWSFSEFGVEGFLLGLRG